ncbi:MAG: transposase [Piscirickettsiaceae bacterium]|nr:transposase [Piscirickettsiaceae bacterium]
MTRPLRLEFAGALYHITSRGDRQEAIYETDADRENYLRVLSEVCEHYNWVCHAYCLMDNHYHLLIETPEANLAKGMRQLNGKYTQTFNRAHRRVGHVFQGRYKSILVDKDSYLLELARYIVLNPVRAGMVRSATEWPWSSYRATVGQHVKPIWLNTDWLLAGFGQRKSNAIEAYKQFISEGTGQSSPWQQLKNQMFLGDDNFIKSMQELIDGNKDLSEISSSQRRALPKEIAYYQENHKTRNEAITSAYASGGYSLKELGDYFELHYSTVSGIIKNHKSKT